MIVLVRFSVLALALVGFSASTVVSHEQQTVATRAGKLAPTANTMNTCTPHGGCTIDY